MKQYTGINLLCGLIILILAASVCMPVYKCIEAFSYGFSEGMKQAESEELNALDMYVPVAIEFQPTAENYYSPTDTVSLGDKSRYPMLLSQATLMIPSDKVNTGAYVSKLLLSLVSIVLVIVLIVAFIKFVVSINKGQIFELKNVKRLARIGVLLLTLSLLAIGMGVCDIVMANEVCHQADGYSLNAAWSIPFADAMLGLLALMLAAIWRKGLALQSEQELTI